jgi:hypothetical protein
MVDGEMKARKTKEENFAWRGARAALRIARQQHERVEAKIEHGLSGRSRKERRNDVTYFCLVHVA